MLAKIVNVEITANIQFDAKEIELLQALSEYDQTPLIEAIMYNTKRYTKEEWKKFFTDLRAETSRIITSATDVQKRLFDKAYGQ